MNIIRAYSPMKQVSVVLHYPTIEDAKKHNPYLTDFEYINAHTVREKHTMYVNNTQTEIPAWIQEERAQLGETPTGERLPTFKLVPGKVVSFTVKVSGEPFGEYRDQEKGVIKKIIPVYGKQDGVEGDYNLWLNVKNPLYKEMLDKLAQGVTKFFVSTSGSQDKTRYALVEME